MKIALIGFLLVYFYDWWAAAKWKDRIGDTIKKAKKGKVDYILTKSISRVSKDTLELLKIIRFLREKGINIHFENENLDSNKSDKEIEITLRSMLAQDESKNISENIQWDFQRKFEKGDIFTKLRVLQVMIIGILRQFKKCSK